MMQRIDQVHHLPGARCVAERGEGHRRPHRAVGVLPAVLAHAGHVAGDVARVRARGGRTAGRAAAPGRRLAHQVRRHRVHRAAHALGAADARQHRPALRDRVDAALGAVASSRAACRRRSRRGDTSRRPSRPARGAARGRRARRRSAARTPRRRAAAPAAANSRSTSQRKKPSQTLSPRPCEPTRFMPSFQSPPPISGRPCAPKRRPCCTDRRACS